MSAKRRILLAEFTPRIPQPATYATWNPSDRNAALVLGGGNLTVTTSATSSAWSCVRATVPMLAGQHYWETVFNYTGAGDCAVGIASGTFSLSLQPGQDAFLTYQSVGVNKSGVVSVRGTALVSLGAIPSGATVRHWLDLDARIYYLAVNNGPWVRVTAATDGDALDWTRIGSSPIFPIAGLTKPSGTCSIVGRFTAPFGFPVPDTARAGVYSTPAPVPTTVYLASEAFNTGDSDTPKNTEYLARIPSTPDVIIERGITCWPWGGSVSSRRGQLAFVFNGLVEWLKWLWRDAPYTLYSGYEGDARSAFTVWSRGVVESFETTDNDQAVITFADPLAKLERSALPQSYPADQANAAIAGKSVPMVLGRPLYCEGVLRSTATAGADAYCYDLDYVGLDGIDAVYDKGDVFAGPNDPYTANNPITLANGGNFTTWVNDPALGAGLNMPQNFGRVTGFGAANDRFQQGAVAGTLRMLSSGQAWTAIYHSASSVLAGYRYVISFTVTAVAKAGQIIFRADGPTPNLPFDDVVVPITATGSVVVSLDVTEQAQLQIVLGRTELDVTIDNLTVSSVQVIDWTMPDTRSFKLTNKPVGKVTANPRGAREAFDWISLQTFKDWAGDNPVGWAIMGGPETATLRVTQSGASARFQAPSGSGTYIGLTYADTSRILRAGHTYFVSVGCSAAATGQVFVMVDNGSGTSYGAINAVGSQVITVTPATSGRLFFRTPNGTATDISLSYVQVSDVRVAEGLPDILRQLLVNRAGVADADVDWASVLAVDDGMPDDTDRIPCRLADYSGQQARTYGQIIRAVMDSFCGWCVPDRLGRLRFGALRKPAGTPVLTLDSTNIVGEPRLRPDLAPNLTTKLAGRRNHSPFSSSGDLATSVPDALRAELIAEYTRTVSAAPGLLTAGLQPINDVLLAAIDAPPRPTLLQETVGLQIQINRLATSYREPCWFLDVDVTLAAAQADLLEPGQIVRVVWPDYGLADGALMLVVRVPSAFFGEQTNLTLWSPLWPA